MLMEPIYCIYHTVDADGWGSAAIVALKFGINNVIMIPYDYAYDFDSVLKRIQPKSTVFAVDVSFPKDGFKKLIEVSDKVIWIDHHETAIEEFKTEPSINDLDGIRRIGTAACELVWEYLFPDKEKNLMLKLIGANDVHNMSYAPDMFIIRSYIFTNEMKPGQKDFGTLMELVEAPDHVIQSLIRLSELAYLYQVKENKVACLGIARDINWGPYRAIAANRGGIGSNFFDAKISMEHDFMICYNQTKTGQWKYTLYSNKPEVHVGNIAVSVREKLGLINGGGHSGAAGFICDYPLDELLEILVGSNKNLAWDRIMSLTDEQLIAMGFEMIRKNNKKFFRKDDITVSRL